MCLRYTSLTLNLSLFQMLEKKQHTETTTADNCSGLNLETEVAKCLQEDISVEAATYAFAQCCVFSKQYQMAFEKYQHLLGQLRGKEVCKVTMSSKYI